MTDATFRERLVDWMERNDFSDDYVAAVVDVSVSSVRRWREGITRPRPILQRFVMRRIEEHDAVPEE